MSVAERWRRDQPMIVIPDYRGHRIEVNALTSTDGDVLEDEAGCG